MKATLIGPVPGFRGVALLYRLSPPITYTRYDDECNERALSTEYVIVSAVIAFGDGPETYIFPASADGIIASWGELFGSFRGALDHARALRGAGYSLD